MEWYIPDVIMDKRLKWLGHLDWIDDKRLLKNMLFGELMKRRACHGPKKRWRDLVLLDLQVVPRLKEDWYWLCQERKEWFELCQDGMDEVALCRKKNIYAANRGSQVNAFFVCVLKEVPEARGSD